MSVRLRGGVENLSLAVFHDWNPDRLFMLVTTVYMDASGHHDGSHAMTLAGRVATARQWRNFDRQWNWLLNKWEIECFHAKEMRARVGEFRRWTDEDATAFIEHGGRIVGRNTLFGFSTVLKPDDFAAYKAAEPAKGARPYGRYGVSFLATMLEVPRIVHRSFRSEPLQVNFVLESGDPGGDQARELFDDAKKRAPPELARVLGTLTYAAKCDFPGLQSADFLAYGAFQMERDPQPSLTHLPKRSKIQQAKKAASYPSPVYRLQITQAVLSEFSQKSLVDIVTTRRIKSGQRAAVKASRARD